MAHKTQRPPQVICAKNIAFLHLLHVVPSEPTTRIVHDTPKDRVVRCLSLEQERHLSGTLAVLSSIEENTKFITAVAIRELRESRDAEQSFLQVLLAVNKSCPESAEAYLEASSQGLERVLRVLSRATRGKSPSGSLQTWAEHKKHTMIVSSGKSSKRLSQSARSASSHACVLPSGSGTKRASRCRMP